MIIIALGANLPGLAGQTSLETCRRAVMELSGLANISVVATSSWWLSAPLPPSDQPPYVNGAVGLSGDIEPQALLAALHMIEAKFGRERSERNAARRLDLDLIAMGDVVRSSPDPILPHPRAHERAFVLLPLLEIAPSWFHPRLKRKASELLAELPHQSCHRI
jgi:2-amino-4-hydroxy-6-hydroxymethyldihydropteridine diphosphokinase